MLNSLSSCRFTARTLCSGIILSCVLLSQLSWAGLDQDRITVGLRHALAIKGGYVWVWGDNTEGQLGLDPNGLSNVAVPRALDALPADIEVVCAGGAHSLALDSTGQVWSWGRNREGQLGDGGFDDRYEPNRVSINATIKAIAVGENVSLAVDDNNDVWAWGDNRMGQVGASLDLVGQFIPEPLRLNIQVQALSAHTEHNLAVTLANAIGWGRGFERQLDYGNTNNQGRPIQVLDANDLVSVAPGAFHSLALTADGDIWAWGQNTEGQLGDGSFVSPNEPVFTVFDTNEAAPIVSIQGGYQHSLAQDTNSTVWAWGDNQYGQLGNGLVRDMNAVPQRVDVNDVNALAVGQYYNLALDAANVAWGWGQWHFDSNDVNDVNHPEPTAIIGFPSLLDVNSTAGGSVREPTEEVSIYGVGDRVSLQAQADDNHNFIAWTGSAVEVGLVDDPLNPNTMLTIMGDHTVVAKFEAVTYKLTVIADEGGRIVLPNPSTVDANSLVPVSILTRAENDQEGYTFMHWELLAGGQGEFADANNPNTTFTVQGDSTIIAIYQKVPLAGLVEPLLTVVKEALDLESTPTQRDMERLVELQADTRGISDLTGLEYATNLKILNLNNNLVTDVNDAAIIAQLHSLETLQLDNNGFMHVDVIAEMDQLITLHLNDNPIADYEVFSRLRNIQYLMLNNTNQIIEDIPESWLATLTQLRTVVLFDNVGLRQSDPVIRKLHFEICRPNGGGVVVSP